MKNKNTVWLFACGMVAGIVLTLSIGAADSAPKPDYSRLQMVSYPNGGTGFFDPATGKVYVYDVNLAYCYMIREITTLGEPMKQILTR